MTGFIDDAGQLKQKRSSASPMTEPLYRNPGVQADNGRG